MSPRQCPVCGRRLSVTEQGLCSVCLLHMPRTTFQFTPYDNPMAQLFWGLAPISRAAAWFYYEPHSEHAQLIYKLKYADRPDIGEYLGALMAQEMLMAGYFDGVDILMPVPLSRKRKRQRGYNQSEMVCRGINAVTQIPINTRALSRQHFHQSQTKLMRFQRRENVANMFELRHSQDLEGKHIMLVDDVCTTGSTLTACATELNKIPSTRLSILTLGFTKG